eukprot:comp20675_c0_seq1/m.42291 comp20675_c0_seq1/g.42291  ORF comp20675_c0_seq1/g.42291 comp20675_c0_seq1/m.42291 type:complete len:540 (-) comp20675_c0_seq1:942-2561(-)
MRALLRSSRSRLYSLRFALMALSSLVMSRFVFSFSASWAFSLSVMSLACTESASTFCWSLAMPFLSADSLLRSSAIFCSTLEIESLSLMSVFLFAASCACDFASLVSASLSLFCSVLTLPSRSRILLSSSWRAAVSLAARCESCWARAASMSTSALSWSAALRSCFSLTSACLRICFSLSAASSALDAERESISASRRSSRTMPRSLRIFLASSSLSRSRFLASSSCFFSLWRASVSRLLSVRSSDSSWLCSRFSWFTALLSRLSCSRSSESLPCSLPSLRASELKRRLSRARLPCCSCDSIWSVVASMCALDASRDAESPLPLPEAEPSRFGGCVRRLFCRSMRFCCALRDFLLALEAASEAFSTDSLALVSFCVVSSTARVSSETRLCALLSFCSSRESSSLTRCFCESAFAISGFRRRTRAASSLALSFSASAPVSSLMRLFSRSVIFWSIASASLLAAADFWRSADEACSSSLSLSLALRAADLSAASFSWSRLSFCSSRFSLALARISSFSARSLSRPSWCFFCWSRVSSVSYF